MNAAADARATKSADFDGGDEVEEVVKIFRATRKLVKSVIKNAAAFRAYTTDEGETQGFQVAG